MGFLIMDEFFDCWTIAKNPYDYHLYFRDWSERDEAATIQRDRNHPSIILYSVGNEIHDTPKPEIAIPILKQLVATAHANDPTRPSHKLSSAPTSRTTTTTAAADLLDVVGQNYRENEILKAHADKPTRKIIGTENTHDRNQWVAMRDHPSTRGNFFWSGIDYLGEAGRWPSIGAGSGLLLTTSLPTRPSLRASILVVYPTHGPHRPPRASRPPLADRPRLRLTHVQQSSRHDTQRSARSPPPSANPSSSTGPQKTKPHTPKTSKSTPTPKRSNSSSTTNRWARKNSTQTPAP